MTLVTALLILLRSASKITHKAQAVTCLAAKWHVCSTLDSFDSTDGETPRAAAAAGQDYHGSGHERSDSDDAGDEEDDLDNTNLIPAYEYNTISYQKRQALGKSHDNLSTHTHYIYNVHRLMIFFLYWQ